MVGITEETFGADSTPIKRGIVDLYEVEWGNIELTLQTLDAGRRMLSEEREIDVRIQSDSDDNAVTLAYTIRSKHRPFSSVL